MNAKLRAANLVNALYLAALTLLMLVMPDRWWWGAPVLYLPGWLWGVPSALLLVISLVRARRAAWIPCVGIAWVLIVQMDANLPLHAKDVRRPLASLRILTYNVRYDIPRFPAPFPMEILRHSPDLLVMQEATAAGEMIRAANPSWKIWKPENYLVASSLPTLDQKFVKTPILGEDFRYVRFKVLLGGIPVTVFVVHFLTPRIGMEEMFSSPARSQHNADIRLQQAHLFRDAVAREKGPLIVAGDLNATVRSALCQPLLDIGLRDAFSEVGTGYGYTYGHDSPFKHSFARIDHILYSRHFKADNCWVGGTAGSDHRPLIANLSLVSR